MQAKHLDQVTILSDQLGYPCTVNEITKRFFDISKSAKHALFVATDAKDHVYGWIQVNQETASLVAGDRAEVSALIVDEKARGKSIGSLLLKEAEKWATTNNLPLVRVRSNTKRDGAHRFYEREGYTLTKSWNLFTKNL